MTDVQQDARRMLAALPTDPSLHLHRFDIKERTAVIARLDEAAIRRAAFLDDRALSPGSEAVVVPIEAAISAIGAIEARPHDAIFHIARCGSTLVSRMLQALPRNLHKREPLPWLACGIHARQLGQELAPRAFGALFEATARSLARGFTPGSRVVVKSTSVAASLIPFHLAREPSQRAIGLTLPLERWLATVLDDESSVENIVGFAPYWKGDLLAMFPDSGLQDHLFTPGELLAMSWCAPMRWFANAVEHHPDRFKMFDVDRLLEHPTVGLAALAAHLKVEADADDITAVTSGPLLESYSKDPDEPFDRAVHAERITAAKQRHAIEIAAGMKLAERFASVPLIADNLS